MKLATLALLTCILAAMAGAEPTELIFRSGFEPDVAAAPENDPDDLVGADKTLEAPTDWVRDLEGNPRIGSFNIQYQGGEPTDRMAHIVPDPTDASNHVLRFWIRHPNVPLPGGGKKCRIQANIYRNNGIRELRQRCRLYLPEDFEVLRRQPDKFGWLTLIEFWNEPG